MTGLKRFVVIGLLSLSLALTGLTFLHPGTAEAAPRRGTLGPTATTFIKVAAKARDYAMNTSGSVMNYAKMRTAFAPAPNRFEVSWRRQMAAGARQAGTRITYISAAESREVERIRVRAWPCRACRTTAAGKAIERMLAPPSNSCGTGQSKYQSHSPLLAKRWRWSHWHNSCETNIVISYNQSCALWVGLVSGLAFFPAKAVGAIGGYYSAICATRAQWISTARDNSKLKAVILRTGYVTAAPKGGTSVVFEWFSQ